VIGVEMRADIAQRREALGHRGPEIECSVLGGGRFSGSFTASSHFVYLIGQMSSGRERGGVVCLNGLKRCSCNAEGLEESMVS
jgi:hypothetical protein